MPDLTLDEINRLRALEKAATPGDLYAVGRFVHAYMDAAPALLDMARECLRWRERFPTLPPEADGPTPDPIF